MTAGRGISHTEETPEINSGRLRGVQLWVALPDSVRNMDPSFSHLLEVPKVEIKGGLVRIFAGSGCGETSPAPHYSGIVGLEVQVHRGASLEMALEEEFEHAILLLDGDASFEEHPLEINKLYYLGSRRAGLRFSSQGGGQILLIGGAPFVEPILMWWNFVARTADELMEARTAWELGQLFGEVPGDHGERLSAPPPIQFARPNPAS
jgi:redox-sensitive bicupin YhaK (pirin superfamily)